MSQLLNPPAPPESRKTMKPRIELIGTTGYAIRIQANLSGANHVKLSIAKTSILPDEGDIIGWKKAYVDDTMPPRPVIVKLLIPADAQRSNGTGRKCRASTARVLDLQDKQGNSLPPDTTAYSGYDTDFTYKKRRNRARRKLRHQPVERMRPPASTSSSPASKPSNTRRLQMNNEIQRFEFQGCIITRPDRRSGGALVRRQGRM